MGRPLGLEPSAGVYPAEGQCWRQTETKWHVAARGRAGGGSAEAPRQGDTARRGQSPLCAKVFLHHVLDEWCGKDVRPRRQGHGFLTRCADDGSIGCEREAEARRMLAVRPKRFTRCRRPMHPEQTALMACKRPPSRERAAGRTGPCDVLGLTP